MPVKKIESLSKHQSPATNTNPFDVENYLNANWDKIKDTVDNNADELINLQGDNTANKQDISNIKKEQIVQNENISKLQEENTKLKLENSLLSSQIPVGQASGEYIILNDSSNMPIEEFKIIGKSQQETRSGKNIANLQEYSCSESYSDLNIEINNDEITISTNSLRIATEFIRIPLTNLKNSTYTFGVDLKSNVENAKAQAQALIYDSTNKKIVSTIFTNNTTSYVTKTAQVVIDETVDINNTFIFLYCLGSVGNAYSYSYKKIFFNEGVDAEYEKYGVMPSLRFPSEIKNVTSVNLKMCNKNLTDYKDWVRVTAVSSFNITGDTLTYDIVNNCYGLTDIERKLKPNTNYTAYCDYSFNGTLGSQWGFRVKHSKNGWENISNSNILNFITDETGLARITFYIGFPYSGENATLILKNIRLYEGTYTIENIPEYEKHQEQSFTFPLSEEQKLYENSYISSDGTHHKKAQIKLDGTEIYATQTQSMDNIFYTALKINNMKEKSVLICSHFKNRVNPNINEGINASYQNYIYFGANIELIGATSDMTVLEKTEKWKVFLNEQETKGIPVTIEYELAEEVIEPYTEEQQEAYNQIQQSCTYKNKTYIFSEDDIAPEFEVKYKKDLETLLNSGGGN